MNLHKTNLVAQVTWAVHVLGWHITNRQDYLLLSSCSYLADDM